MPTEIFSLYMETPTMSWGHVPGDSYHVQEAYTFLSGFAQDLAHVQTRCPK
jgi:hypothetical protein